MRNIKLTLCAMALAAASTSALAATQGTITFAGKLISETCAIDGSEDQTVQLPTLSINTLDREGVEAGSTGFDLKVSCPPGIPQVAAHFEAIDSSGLDTATGNLTNALTGQGAATKVQVRLYNSNQQALPVGSTGSWPDPDSTTTPPAIIGTPVTGGVATMRYFGGYYATGATTAGLVKAQVRYTLAYP